MNNLRGKTIQSIREGLESLCSELEEVLEEEQDYYDNMPEGIQDSERGEKAYEAISQLEDAISSLKTLTVA